MIEEAQVFCLPSYYAYSEGQPVSILEAYASGCYVVTTNHGGISDIFKDKVNGSYVEKRSSEDLAKLMVQIINADDKTEYASIGFSNAKEANAKYSHSVFKKNAMDIFGI
jgi:glycosyltransferase involved in cell wall biosynthesis